MHSYKNVCEGERIVWMLQYMGKHSTSYAAFQRYRPKSVVKTCGTCAMHAASCP